ncbi:YceH family protein [Pseudoxanthomonas winnipegensis]|uniref:YceH family protein n=1 Tax=Pseudoxanthomonas winnipegensis TaxID=2480810 RepID=UPI003F87FAA0
MTDAADLPVLDTAQARLLGCLIEKEATTPDVYPLTVNAAVSAANQKTARDPVMNLQAGAVQHALRALEALGLARQQFSSRAERYEHLTGKAFSLPNQQVALLGLLLLRGPQTAGELLARAERLASFADAEDVRHHLERLAHREPALVVQIPRGPGQREDRWMHLLAGPVDVAAISARLASGAAGEGAPSALEHRIAELEARVADLEARLAQLQPAGPAVPQLS